MKSVIRSMMMMLALGLSSAAVVAGTAGDVWIQGKAKGIMVLNSDLKSSDISTDVKDGKVTLTGTVPTKVEKALAEELVAGLDDVKSVDNRLKVSTGDDDNSGNWTGTVKDSKTAAVIKTRLLFESEIKGTDINVDVKDNVVTLSGQVGSSAQKELALKIAENANDVTRVVDKLKVRS